MSNNFNSNNVSSLVSTLHHLYDNSGQDSRACATYQ